MAFVQAPAAATSSGSAASLGKAFTSNVTVGDLIIAAIHFDNALTYSSISDTQGNVYTQAGAETTDPLTGEKARVFYAIAGSTGANTVTFATAAGTGFRYIAIAEYSGTTTFDTSAETNGSGGTPTSPSFTVAQAGSLLFVFVVATGTASAAGGYNSRVTTNGDLLEDKTPSTGAQTATATQTGTSGYNIHAVVFNTGGGVAAAPTQPARSLLMTLRPGQMRMGPPLFAFPADAPQIATTPVSSAIGLAVEFLQGIVTTSDLPFESQQGVAQSAAEGFESQQGVLQTSSLPFETLTGLAQTSGLPLEILLGIAASLAEALEIQQGIATSTPIGFESLQAIAATNALSFETLKALAQTYSLPLEWLLGIAQAYAEAYESQQGIAQTSPLPFETLLGLAQSLALPLEIIQGVARALGVPFETQLGVSLTQGVPFESLQGVLASTGLPLEWLQAISTTYVLPLEILQGLNTSKVLPLEILQGIAAALSLPWETEGGAASAVSQAIALPFETQQGIAQTPAQPFETQQGVSQVSTGPIEWQLGIVKTYALPVEAPQGIAATKALPFESVGAIASTPLLPFETLQPVSSSILVTNYVTNGGFESNTTGWAGFAAATITRVTSGALFGGGALDVDGSAGSGRGARYTTVSTLPQAGETWTASAYVVAQNPGDIGKTVTIGFTTRTTGETASTSVVLSDGYQRVSVTKTVTGAGATGFFVDVLTSGAGARFLLDGVQAELSASANPYVETNGAVASQTFGVTAPFEILKGVISGYTVTNRTLNSGLETSIFPWLATGTATITRDLTQAHSGSAGLKVVTSGGVGSGGYFAQSGYSVGPGGSYTGSLWVKPAAGETVYIFLRLTETGILAVTGPQNQVTGDGVTWFRLSTTVNFTPGHNWNVIELGARSLDGVAKTFYIDDAQFTDGPDLWPDIFTNGAPASQFFPIVAPFETLGGITTSFDLPFETRSLLVLYTLIGLHADGTRVRSHATAIIPIQGGDDQKANPTGSSEGGNPHGNTEPWISP